MARGVNKVILIGNLGDEPELKYSPSGMAICNVSIATSESWTDKDTGEKKEKTEWHNLVFFRRLAEVAGEYLHKGSKIYVEGKLQTDKYEKDGVTRYFTKVIVGELQMLDSRSRGSGGNSEYAEPTTSAPAQAGLSADFDDDIPF